MRKLGAMTAILSIGVLAAFGWVSAQGSSPTLTGEDYGEIMQLYGRYNQANDFRDPELYMSAFADDAVFRPLEEVVVGREALLARLRGRIQEGQEGTPGGSRHYTNSWVITPTEDGGAKGRAYWMAFNVSGEQPRAGGSGYIDDVFVKTSKGWRIKSRTLYRDRQ